MDGGEATAVLVKTRLMKLFKGSIRWLHLQYSDSNSRHQLSEQGEILATIIEATFLHGLRSKFSLGSLFSSGEEQNSNFWQLATAVTHGDVTQRVTQMSLLTSPIGFCRAWVRVALNEDMVARYVTFIQQDPVLVKKNYRRYAFMADQNCLDVMLACLQGLGSFNFELPSNSSLLNFWSNSLLLSCGKIDYKLPGFNDVDGEFCEGELAYALDGEEDELEAVLFGDTDSVTEPQLLPSLVVETTQSEAASQLSEGSTLDQLTSPTEAEDRRFSAPSPRSPPLSPQLRSSLQGQARSSPQPPSPARQLSPLLSPELARARHFSPSSSRPMSPALLEIVTERGHKRSPSDTTVQNLFLGNDIPRVASTDSFTLESQDSLPETSTPSATTRSAPLPLRNRNNRNALGMLGTSWSSSPVATHLITQDTLEDSSDSTSTQEGGALTGEPEGRINSYMTYAQSYLPSGLPTSWGTGHLSSSSEATSESLVTTVGEFEVIDDELKSSMTESVISRYAVLYIVVCTEKGLPWQDFKCAECDQQLGPFFAEYRVCSYDGLYYCSDCHHNEETVIPSRALYSWDLKMYKVCRRAAIYLRSQYEIPRLDVKQHSPLLYKQVQALNVVRQVRKRLHMLHAYLFTCSQQTIDLLRKVVWPKEHLYQSKHLYAVSDLVQLKVVAKLLEKALKRGKTHILACRLCSQKGYICEICHANEVIYPFDLEENERCHRCHALFHRKCRPAGVTCPKCERLHLRRQNISSALYS